MNILIVGNNPELQTESINALQLALGDAIEVTRAASLGAARLELQKRRCPIVLDLGLPEEGRWRLPRLVRQLDPLAQVVIVFESDQEDQIPDALRQGADEALTRSSSYLSLLPLIVERAFERYLMLRERQQSPPATPDLETLHQSLEDSQDTDTGKSLKQARSTLHQISVLLERCETQLNQRRILLRQAGSKVQRLERGLKALSRLTETVSRSTDLDTILANVLDQALTMTAADAGAVLIVENQSKPFRLAVQKNLSENLMTILSNQHTDASALMASLAAGKVLLVQEIDRSNAPPELLTLLSEERLLSMLSVPLQTGGNLLGGLLVATHHAGQLTPRDAHWLRALGQQAGIAIENTRLRTKIWEAAETWFAQPTTSSLTETVSEESKLETKRLSQTLRRVKHQLRRREEALTAIINVIGTASYHPDVQAILKETLQHILERSEAGGIWLLDEASGNLSLVAQRNLPQSVMRSWQNQEWTEDELLAPLMGGEIVYLDAPSTQRGDGLLGVLKDAGARVVVGIPLQIQQQNVGTMVIIARKTGHLQAHDAEQLAAVGQQLSQALERERLHDDRRRLALKLKAVRAQKTEHSQRQQEQLATLYQISQLLTQDNKRAIKMALKATLDALEASGGLILQRDASRDHFFMIQQLGLPGSFVDNWALRSIQPHESLTPSWLDAPHFTTITSETDALPRLAANLIGSDHIQALVVAPLPWPRRNGEPIGLLALVFSAPEQKGETRDESPFELTLTEEQAQWLQLLTQMMTLSIAQNGSTDSR